MLANKSFTTLQTKAQNTPSLIISSQQYDENSSAMYLPQRFRSDHNLSIKAASIMNSRMSTDQSAVRIRPYFQVDYDHVHQSKSLDRFVEGIEIWRNNPDCPEYVDTLFSTLVSDIDSLRHPQNLGPNSSISDALQAVKGAETVMVDQPVNHSEKLCPCRLFSRLSLVQHGLQAPSLADPISSILDNIPCLEWVDEADTLDTALRAMVSSGCEAVGVASDGAAS